MRYEQNTSAAAGKLRNTCGMSELDHTAGGWRARFTDELIAVQMGAAANIVLHRLDKAIL